MLLRILKHLFFHKYYLFQFRDRFHCTLFVKICDVKLLFYEISRLGIIVCETRVLHLYLKMPPPFPHLCFILKVDSHYQSPHFFRSYYPCGEMKYVNPHWNHPMTHLSSSFSSSLKFLNEVGMDKIEVSRLQFADVILDEEETNLLFKSWSPFAPFQA